VLCFPAFRLRQRVSATCCIRERVRTLMYIPHARSKGGVGHATNAFLNAAASRLVTVGYGWYGPPWAATCVLRERACTIPVTRCTLEAKADCLPLWSLGLALLITTRQLCVPVHPCCAVQASVCRAAVPDARTVRSCFHLLPCCFWWCCCCRCHGLSSAIFLGVLFVLCLFFFFHINTYRRLLELFFSLSVSFLFVYLCTHLGPAPGNCFRLC